VICIIKEKKKQEQTKQKRTKNKTKTKKKKTRPIRSTCDCASLQRDIDNLVEKE